MELKMTYRPFTWWIMSAKVWRSSLSSASFLPFHLGRFWWLSTWRVKPASPAFFSSFRMSGFSATPFVSTTGLMPCSLMNATRSTMCG